MSGIYGIINFEGKPVEQEQLNKMSLTMQHRAPDGQNSFHKHNVGFGHLSMQLSPESLYEKQPLQYKNWIVVLDGRFFYREKLLKNLEISPTDYSTTPDSILLVKAFEKWGKSCVQHLIGEYAFLIWDTVKQEAFCAKDRFGNRPFFYYQNGQCFCFASELIALVNLPFVKTAINYEWLLQSIQAPMGIQKNATPFQHIFSVLKAHTFTIHKNGKAQKCFWQPTYQGSLKLKSDQAYIELFQQNIQAAIYERMRTNYPVAVALSGGLDSSVVACYAARKLAAQNRPLIASGFQAPPERKGSIGDELRYMEAVAQQEKNIIFKPVEITPPSTAHNQKHQQNYGMPSHFGSACWHGVFETAQSHQARVLLTGFLGDDVISRKGEGSYQQLIHEKRWRAIGQLLQQRSKAQNTFFLKMVMKDLFQVLPMGFQKSLRKLKHRDTYDSPTSIFHQFLKPSFFETCKAAFDIEKIQKQYAKFSPHEQLHFILEQGIDYASDSISIPAHRHQLVYTTPLADVNIIEFAMTLPPEKWLLNGEKRGLLRAATKGLLPEVIRNRKSKGFISLELGIFTTQQLEHYLFFIKSTDSNHPAFKYIDKNKLIQFIIQCKQKRTQGPLLIINQIMNIFSFDFKSVIPKENILT